MTHYHTALLMACSAKECGVTETFPNPGEFSDHVMDGLAIRKGWYIANYGGGDLCPKHHLAAAGKFGWTSFYEGPVQKTVTIDKADKAKKKKEAA